MSDQADVVRCAVCDNQMAITTPTCLVCGTPNPYALVSGKASVENETPQVHADASTPGAPSTSLPSTTAGLESKYNLDLSSIFGSALEKAQPVTKSLSDERARYIEPIPTGSETSQDNAMPVLPREALPIVVQTVEEPPASPAPAQSGSETGTCSLAPLGEAGAATAYREVCTLPSARSPETVETVKVAGAAEAVQILPNPETASPSNSEILSSSLLPVDECSQTDVAGTPVVQGTAAPPGEPEAEQPADLYAWKPGDEAAAGTTESNATGEEPPAEAAEELPLPSGSVYYSEHSPPSGSGPGLPGSSVSIPELPSRPQPGTAEYEALVRQALAVRGIAVNTGPAPGYPSREPLDVPASPGEGMPGQPGPDVLSGARLPRPGTPEYEEMARQAFARRAGAGESQGGLPPGSQALPAPLTEVGSNSPQPKPGTPEYEALVRQALARRTAKRGGP